MPRERIGIIYVHGIGEQRRFEHLDSQVRPLIEAIRRRQGKPRMTAEIVGGAAAQLHAEQDSWTVQPGAPLRIFVDDGGDGVEIFCHEVWWADVNEPYSLMKQMKFWVWGLSVWALPSRLHMKLPGAKAAMRLPAFPGGLTAGKLRSAQLKLFGVSNIFLMGALSIGAATFLAKRLLDFATFDVVRVFVNYVSAVKLYNQTRRSDGGFLDAYDEPPRVSIRRRMIRALADVALQKYERWYIFAHSLGSVVAHNGLMESAHAMPNYVDEQRWADLVNEKWAGPRRPDDIVGPIDVMFAGAAVWLDDRDVVYRDLLFGKFRGLLTYGSPLDKFATIWPVRVPINNQPAFHHETEWINVYDPTDPVGASIDAFGAKPVQPPQPGDLIDIVPDNYGYRAHWALLYSHLCYLSVHKKRQNEFSDNLVEWLIDKKPFSKIKRNPGLWYLPQSSIEQRRTWAARCMWVSVYLGLTLLGMFSAPFFVRVAWELMVKAAAILCQVGTAITTAFF